MPNLPPQLRDHLVCPATAEPLTLDDQGALSASGTRYPMQGGALDLRLREPKRVAVELELAPRGLDEGDLTFRPLRACPVPAVDFSGVDAPRHLTPAILSHFPRADPSGALALDLGCGDGVHRGVVERAEFTWVGLDYGHARAPLLGDAHALPFGDETFAFVLSIAVLEHLQHPVLAAREVCRVLRPGGLFLGTVAFLEPFHGRSFYHHSPLGVVSTLREGGLRVEAVAPHETWSGLSAFVKMGTPAIPGVQQAVRWGAGSADRAQRLIWRLLTRYRQENEVQRDTFLAHTTGSFAFVAYRPT